MNNTKIKLSSKECVRNFGLTKKNLKKLGVGTRTEKFNTLNDVMGADVGMVFAQCKFSSFLTISDENVEIKRGETYAMPFGIYNQANKEKKIFEPYRRKFSEVFRRYRGQNLDGKKLLVWRMGGIGDLIVIQSVLKAIKERFPTVYIIFATSPQNVKILKSFPKKLIDEITTLPINKKYFDMSAYHLTFINTIEGCIETQKMNYFDIFQRVSGLEYNSNNYISELIPNKIILEKIRPLIPLKTILIHMASTTKLRSYPTPGWVFIMTELIKKGYFVGITDSPNNSKAIDEFIINANLDTTRTLNFSKLTPMDVAIAGSSLCYGYIGIDSSFAHIMGALRKPGVVICGPYPSYNVVSKYLSLKGIDANNNWNECKKYPCFYNSQEHLCPFVSGGFFPGCTSSISPQLIIENLEKQIEFCYNLNSVKSTGEDNKNE